MYVTEKNTCATVNRPTYLYAVCILPELLVATVPVRRQAPALRSTKPSETSTSPSHHSLDVRSGKDTVLTTVDGTTACALVADSISS